MSSAQDAVEELLLAGYSIVPDSEDPGVLRVRTLPEGRLVGLLVIRERLLTYAELLGTVFPLWVTFSYSDQVDEIREFIRENRP